MTSHIRNALPLPGQLFVMFDDVKLYEWVEDILKSKLSWPDIDELLYEQEVNQCDFDGHNHIAVISIREDAVGDILVFVSLSLMWPTNMHLVCLQTVRRTVQRSPKTARHYS